MVLLVIVTVALLVYVRYANRDSAMADRSFHVARVPGFATTAVIVFVALYLPIYTLMPIRSTPQARSRSGAVLAGVVQQGLGEPAGEGSDDQVADHRQLRGRDLDRGGHGGGAGNHAAAGVQGQTFIYVMINQPLMVPEIVTAVALMILFGIRRSGCPATGWTTWRMGCTGSSWHMRPSASRLPTCRSGAAGGDGPEPGDRGGRPLRDTLAGVPPV